MGGWRRIAVISSGGFGGRRRIWREFLKSGWLVSFGPGPCGFLGDYLGLGSWPKGSYLEDRISHFSVSLGIGERGFFWSER